MAFFCERLFLWRNDMPFDSEGNFTRVHNWDEDRQNDIDIASDRMDEEFDNYANALNNCALRDGRTPLTGDLDLGNFKITNVSSGSTEYDAVNRKQLESVNNAITTILNEMWQVGDVKTSVKSEDHGAWMLCHGQAISRSTYSELFDIIGTNFGAGDGEYTFNLPDYRGKFLRGLGGDSADDIYTTQSEGLPNISGTFGNINSRNGYQSPIKTYTGAFSKQTDVNQSGYKTDTTTDSGAGILKFSAQSSNAIYGNSNHVTPINQAVNFFIKVKREEAKW